MGPVLKSFEHYRKHFLKHENEQRQLESCQHRFRSLLVTMNRITQFPGSALDGYDFDLHASHEDKNTSDNFIATTGAPFKAGEAFKEGYDEEAEIFNQYTNVIIP